MQIYNHNLDRNLMRALSFDANDLEANRAGQLTKRQRRATRVQHIKVVNYFGRGAILLVLAAAMWNSDTGFSDASDEVMITAGFVSFLVLAAWGWLRIRVDFTKGCVWAIDGYVSLDTRPRKYWVNHYVIVQGIQFQIDKETMLAFHNGQRYTIYYTPYAKIIVAAEPQYK